MKMYRLHLLVLSILCLGIAKGDDIELQNFFNARYSANFEKNTNNKMKFVLPTGTTGKIEEIKTFNSGNFGLQIELTNGPQKGQKVWVHYNTKLNNSENPQIKLYKPDTKDNSKQEETKEVNEAAGMETLKPTEALKEPVEAAVSSPKNIKAVASEAVKKIVKINKRETVESDNSECTSCNVSSAAISGDDRLISSKKIGNLVVYENMRDGQYGIEIVPNNTLMKTRTREFHFYDDGHMESLDSYGSRGYVLLPRKEALKYSVDGDSVIVTTPSGNKFSISKETGKVKNVTGMQNWTEYAPTLDDDNPPSKEGLELIPKKSQLIVDLGYTKGGFSEFKTRGKSFIRDGNGQNCQVNNSDLFRYQYNDGVMMGAKFKRSDTDFKNFIQSNCSRLSSN